MKKLLIITLAITALLSGIYYLIGNLIPARPSFGNSNKPVEVIVTSVKKELINISRTLPARIKPTKTSQVRPQISGIILKQYFKEGSFVKQGQPLYQIDPKPYFIELNQMQSELNASQIDLKAKQNNFDRLTKLYKIKAISKLHLDDSKTMLEKSKADLAVKQAGLDKVRIKLSYTQVLAPIDGKIGRSFFTQGALVKDMQESPLAIITNLDSVYGDISQSSTKIKEIQDALIASDEIEVELIMPGLKEKSFKKGVLKFSESIIDESSGSVSMRSEFENSDHKLLPGLFVKAKLNLGQKSVLLVAQSSVTINTDGTMTAFAINEDNIIEIKKVTIDGQHKKSWIISSGLSEGDLVIKEGVQKIGPGSKIIPVMSDEEMILTKKKGKKAKQTALDKSEPEKPETQTPSVENSIIEKVKTTDNEETISKDSFKEALTPKKIDDSKNPKEETSNPEIADTSNLFPMEKSILEIARVKNKPSPKIANIKDKDLEQDKAKLHSKKIDEFIKNKLLIAQKEEFPENNKKLAIKEQVNNSQPFSNKIKQKN